MNNSETVKNLLNLQKQLNGTLKAVSISIEVMKESMKALPIAERETAIKELEKAHGAEIVKQWGIK
jgi:pimeloyl-CoA synthetase